MLSKYFPYIISLAVFLGLDLIWLTLAAPLYKKFMGHLMRVPPHWQSAAIFYVVFIFGLMKFVIEPSLAAKSIGKAYVLGGQFGIVTYMTYQLTNYATLKNWSIKLVIMDITWGAFVCSTSASLITWILLKINS